LLLMATSPLSLLPVPVTRGQEKALPASGSVLLRVATADPAAMFSLKDVVERRAVGTSVKFVTSRMITFSKQRPPASRASGHEILQAPYQDHMYQMVDALQLL